MKTKILLIVLGFSIFIVADSKSLFPFLSSSSEGWSENQESRLKEFQTEGKMSKTDPRKPIWFRKIPESRKTLIKGKNKSPTPVVSELRRNPTSVRLTKSCHFDRIKKCTNLEWLEFWNSRMAHSNSISQPAGSQNQKNQATTTELSKDQKKESINLHSKLPLELTRDQIHRVKICNFDKFELCTREEWYKFIKGNQEHSKGQIGSGQTSKGSGSELTKDQKAMVKICNFEKRCTQKEWYEFLKDNNGLNWQLSKSQLI